MKTSKPRSDRIIIVLTIISIFSIFSVAATNILFDNDVYLPLVRNQNPTATATLTPTITPTPTTTLTPVPEPTLEPHPEGTAWVLVTPENEDKDWALAWFQKGENNNGYPIMEIYPGDSSPVEDRIKIDRGEVVLVYDELIRADGGGRFWKLVDYEGRDGEELYLRAEDVTKLERR